MAWSCQTSVSMQFMWCELTTGQTILKVAIKDTACIWLASWNKLKMFVYSHECNKRCTYCHACSFIWNGNVSQTLQNILTFYVPLHICWTKYTQEGFNKLHHPSCSARWLHLNPFGKTTMFQHKNVCLWTPSLCPACFSSQIIAIPNLLNIKTNIHSFKITEVIAKLWHVISFKTIPDTT